MYVPNEILQYPPHTRMTHFDCSLNHTWSSIKLFTLFAVDMVYFLKTITFLTFSLIGGVQYFIFIRDVESTVNDSELFSQERTFL